MEPHMESGENLMGTIKKVTQKTNNRHLNMFDLDTVNEKGGRGIYHIASRADSLEKMKLNTRINRPDGVIIFAVYKNQDAEQDRIVLVKQYRYSIDDYIYEFPSGLIDPGEDFQAAGVREMKEETGLDFHPIDVAAMYSKPFFTTVGMTDESCAMVYGTATGTISKEGLEENEEIEVVLADRVEIRRILKEENVAVMCAYMIMHFLNHKTDDPFDFLKES